MKKMIMAVAVVACAAMTNAASISWGNSSTSLMYDLDGTTKLTSALATTYSLTVSLIDASDNVVASVSAFNSMTAGMLSNAVSTYKYGTDYSAGDTFSIIAKMTQGGTAYEMKIGDYSITKASDNTGSDTFAWAEGKWGGLKGTTTGMAGTWAPVPEPTSGLLLLLGMAGLALKRKHA